MALLLKESNSKSHPSPTPAFSSPTEDSIIMQVDIP